MSVDNTFQPHDLINAKGGKRFTNALVLWTDGNHVIHSKGTDYYGDVKLVHEPAHRFKSGDKVSTPTGFYTIDSVKTEYMAFEKGVPTLRKYVGSNAYDCTDGSWMRESSILLGNLRTAA